MDSSTTPEPNSALQATAKGGPRLSAHAVGHLHRGNQARIVRGLTGNPMLDHQTLPRGIDGRRQLAQLERGEDIDGDGVLRAPVFAG